MTDENYRFYRTQDKLIITIIALLLLLTIVVFYDDYSGNYALRNGLWIYDSLN